MNNMKYVACSLYIHVHIYAYMLLYVYYWGTKACEQWLLLGSRVKNWEAGGKDRRKIFHYIPFVHFGF